MPVTPLHFGVGLIAKGAWPQRVSLASFALSQLIIDAEVAYYLMVAHSWPFHRWAHTLVGAGVLGLASGVVIVWVAKVACRWGVSWLQQAELGEASWRAGIAGGLLGGLTHPILDGIMHDDVRPFLPFGAESPFYGLVPVGVLHAVLVILLIVGALLLAWRVRPYVRSKA